MIMIVLSIKYNILKKWLSVAYPRILLLGCNDTSNSNSNSTYIKYNNNSSNTSTSTSSNR